ncbi:MAG: hypothetical protein OXG52_11875 [bacterium]|nr:hypothetical protein [bacterium]
MRGCAPEFFQGDARAFTDLYFNVESEVFEFYGPVKMRDDRTWVSVTRVFRTGLEDLASLIDGCSDDPKIVFKYQGRLLRLRGVEDVELHIEEIAGDDWTVDEVVEIFNRVNSGGTDLSTGDLALARLCADWPQARSELRSLLDRWRKAGFSFRQEWLLRCTTAVATNQASFGSLRGVSVSEFDGALKKTAHSIDFLLNLLGSWLGIDHERVLAGSHGLATLARLVADSGGSINKIEVQQRMLYWYVHSFLWGRYSGSTETRLQRDLIALEEAGVNGLIAEMELWRGGLEVRPDDFAGSTVGARFYPLLYILTRVNESRDLLNGLQLSHGMLGAHSKLHRHHIFPKKRLYNANYYRAQVNALANFCFLTAESNYAISASDPAVYLAKAEEDNPGVLRSQWVPDDEALWSMDRYPDFLAARRTLLAEAANELLERLRCGGVAVRSDTPVPLSTALRTPTTSEKPVGYDDEEDPEIVGVVLLANELGIAAPETHCEICDSESGDVLAVADLAWPRGVQPGRTDPVVLLLTSDSEAEARLGELGYRFFTTRQRLLWYLEELLGVDIDGDKVIGGVAPAPED